MKLWEGRNTLQLNRATMHAILEEHLDSAHYRSRDDNSYLKVVSVTQSTDEFLVVVETAEKPPEKS